MIAAFMIRETLWNFVYAMRKVVPEEIRNEAIDYGEWQNGYRTEAMAGVVKGLARKLVATFTNGFSSALLGIIGYKQGLKPKQQSDRTERLLFTMTTLLPAATGLIGIIPKLFYNIDSETRERMYKELAIRRAETAKELNKAHELEMAETSAEQK